MFSARAAGAEGGAAADGAAADGAAGASPEGAAQPASSSASSSMAAILRTARPPFRRSGGPALFHQRFLSSNLSYPTEKRHKKIPKKTTIFHPLF